MSDRELRLDRSIGRLPANLVPPRKTTTTFAALWHTLHKPVWLTRTFRPSIQPTRKIAKRLLQGDVAWSVLLPIGLRHAVCELRQRMRNMIVHS